MGLKQVVSEVVFDIKRLAKLQVVFWQFRAVFEVVFELGQTPGAIQTVYGWCPDSKTMGQEKKKIMI